MWTTALQELRSEIGPPEPTAPSGICWAARVDDTVVVPLVVVRRLGGDTDVLAGDTDALMAPASIGGPLRWEPPPLWGPRPASATAANASASAAAPRMAREARGSARGRQWAALACAH